MRRRLAAILSLTLLAQLSLVGASPLCDDPAGSGRGQVQAHVTGHGAPDAEPVGHEHATHGAVPCATTSMCGVVMVVADAAAVEGHVTVGATRFVLGAARPASVNRAPDLPPPRA